MKTVAAAASEAKAADWERGKDSGSPAHSLSHSLTLSLQRLQEQEQFNFQTLHTTSQDGSSLEFVTATEGRECNIQDARGRGL